MQDIDILKNAYEKQAIKQDFEIPTGSGRQPMKASLVMDDFYVMNDELKLIYAKAYGKYAREGLDDVKPPKTALDRYFESLPEITREQEKKNPPASHAELLAQETARNNLVFYLIPKFLINAETGKKICQDEKTEEIFRKLLRGSLKLTQILVENFTLLYKKLNDAQGTAKNSLPPEN